MQVLFRSGGVVEIEIVVAHDTLPVLISCDMVYTAGRWRGGGLSLHWEPGHELSQGYQETLPRCMVRDNQPCDTDHISTHHCEGVLRVANNVGEHMQDMVPVLKAIMEEEIEMRREVRSV
jgi:hypothetical protein